MTEKSWANFFVCLFVSKTYSNTLTNTNTQNILRSKNTKFQILSSDGPHKVTMHRKNQNMPPFYYLL